MSNKKSEVNLTIKELKDFLRHIIENNQHLQERKLNPVAISVVGETGIGKTSSTVQLAEEMGMSLIKLNLAQIEELGDLVGFPIRQFQMKKDEELEWVDEHLLEDYRALSFKATGKKRMSYAPPEWIADKQTGGILLLDDWNRADIRFIQAVMELIDRQEYISWKLPKNWHIILSANPDDSDYLVNTIDDAQQTRYIKVNLKFDIDNWAEWAEIQKIDGRCINFLLKHPELVTRKCNPRSITAFFNSISSIKDFSKELPLIEMIGEGSVGPEFATLFTTFINNRLDKLISPKEILTGKDWDKVKAQLEVAIGRGDSKRVDIAAILTTRILNYSWILAREGGITKDVIARLKDITVDDTIPHDLRYILVRGLMNGDGKEKFERLLNDPNVLKVSVK